MSQWGRRLEKYRRHLTGFYGAVCCEVCSKHIIQLKYTSESAGGYVLGVRPQFILSNKCVHINSGRRRPWKIIPASYYDLIYSSAWPQLLNFLDTYLGFWKVEYFPTATLGALHHPCGKTRSAGLDWNLSVFKGPVKFCGASPVRCGTCTGKKPLQLQRRPLELGGKHFGGDFPVSFWMTHSVPSFVCRLVVKWVPDKSLVWETFHPSGHQMSRCSVCWTVCRLCTGVKVWSNISFLSVYRTSQNHCILKTLGPPPKKIDTKHY